MAPSKKCKRMTVYAMGIDVEGNIEWARNGNKTLKGCRDLIGMCGCEHAEHNLLKRMPNPVAVTLSHSPCKYCADKLIKAGVKKVSFLKRYRKSEGIDLLECHGVEVNEVG
jgi:deoxycytidylate deaminase